MNERKERHRKTLRVFEKIKIDLTVDALSQLLNNPDKLTDNNNYNDDND